MKNSQLIILLLLLLGLQLSCAKREVVEPTPTTPTTTPLPPTITPPVCPLNGNKCELKMTFNQGLTFTFFTNYHFLRTDTLWSGINNVIIVVHGNNRNASDYYNFMHTAIQSLDATKNTLIIAPFFKTNEEISDNKELYWSSAGWKIGNKSNADLPIRYASFEIMDELINAIQEKDYFPNLNKVIITGHSSGGQFTQLYATANNIDSDHQFHYIVANSQYLFYPKPERLNKSTGRFDIPPNCDKYEEWPYGLDSPNNYVESTTSNNLIDNFVNRSIYYLLGTEDIVTTGTLNTSDCEANLLGENRLKRGLNMFSFMETFYPNQHQHIIHKVDGVGHDAAEMYQSPEGLALLRSIIE